MKNSYNRKSVWITGGGSGLGRAMALEYARLGALVAVSGRRVNRLEETVQDIEKQGGSGLAVPCDVSQEDQIISAVSIILICGQLKNRPRYVSGRFKNESVNMLSAHCQKSGVG